MKTGRFSGQPERSVFRCGYSPDLLAALQANPGQPTLFFRKCSYACCACSSSNNHIDSMEEIDRLFKRLYENNISGKINDSRFEKLSVDYENEQAELPKSIIAEMLTHASKSRTA